MTATDDFIINLQAQRRSANSEQMVGDIDLFIAALQALSAGGSTPGGVNGDFQFNNTGSFGGFTPGAGIKTFLTTPSSTNLAAAITDETGTGSLVFGTSPTISTGLTLSSCQVTISGSVSAPAWTTNGLLWKTIPATLTNTTSAGVVAAAYTNLYGGNTIAALAATTFTDYYGSYFTNPAAGANVTITNRWALGCDSLAVNDVGDYRVPVIRLGGNNAGFSSNTFYRINVAIDGKLIAGFVSLGGEGIWTSNISAQNLYGSFRFGDNGATLSLRYPDLTNVRLGNPPNITPQAYTLTIGEDALSGTSNNVAGAAGTIQTGLGTGSGAATTLFLQSSNNTAGTATTAQAYLTGLKIKFGACVLSNYTVANLPAAATVGSGGLAFITDATLTAITGLGLTPIGGGANKVPVYSDGVNWLII